MVDDDHGARALALQAELATSKADAASLRAALEQEKHIAACALATCERLRKERDALRAEVERRGEAIRVQCETEWDDPGPDWCRGHKARPCPYFECGEPCGLRAALPEADR